MYIEVSGYPVVQKTAGDVYESWVNGVLAEIDVFREIHTAFVEAIEAIIRRSSLEIDIRPMLTGVPDMEPYAPVGFPEL